MSDQSKDMTSYLTATNALEQFNSGTLTPSVLLEHVIARAEEISEAINPFADRYFEEALAQARKADDRYHAGTARPLEGLPLLVKDSSAIKGKRATVGSMLYAEEICTYSDPAVERLMDAGAIVFARSTCPEFCWLFTCHSRLWGVTRNPWRLDVTPGGSSGGSAAALAAGATTLATGSDSTGSIRQPASQCGVVGYKSPYGRNPMDAKSSFQPYVNVGPMTRSVADAALMQNIMSGPHPLDHTSLAERVTVPPAPEQVAGLRIAFSVDLGHYLVTEDVEREFRATLQALADAGAEVTEVNIAWASEAIRLAHLHEEFIFAGILEEALKENADKLSPYVGQLYETAAAVTEQEYRRSHDVAGQVWHDHLGPLFAQYDAFLTPAVSCPEVPAENIQKDLLTVRGQQITDTDTAMTALFNMFNRCPVLSVPAGLTDKGLPVGLQVVGRPYDDAMVFRIGHAIETARPWLDELPLEVRTLI